MAVVDRFERVLAILAKIEATEGTDAVPTGGANAMQMSNVSITPLAGEEESRDLVKPYLGDQGVFLTGNYVQIQGDVELAGSGDAGVAPAYDALLRACGMSQTVVADTSVAYDPVSAAFESSSIYWVQAGVRHIALGARGSFTLELMPKRVPHIRFNMMGLLGTISDQAMPTVDHTGFIAPEVVTNANTTIDLHGYTAVAESLQLDLGQNVVPRFLIGEEAMKISGRAASGTAVVKADTLANIDWFDIAQSHAVDALEAVHGTEAGNIVTIDAPAVQIGRPTQGATDGILNYSLPLRFQPSAGNDELSLTFT